MAPANKQYTIREFSYFFCKEDGEKSADNCKLDRQTFEEIKKLVGDHEAMPAYEALRKSIYMGRVPLKRDKIDKFLSNISWR